MLPRWYKHSTGHNRMFAIKSDGKFSVTYLSTKHIFSSPQPQKTFSSLVFMSLHCSICICFIFLVGKLIVLGRLVFNKGAGSYVHFRQRPRSSTCRCARLLWDHTSVQSVHSCPLWPCNHRLCVITKRLGSPQWLAQQGLAFSKASSRPGAPFPFQKTVNVRNLQLGDDVPSDMAV